MNKKIKFALYLVVMYCITSILEWIIHGKISHSKVLKKYSAFYENHMQHHHEILNDMRLKPNFTEAGLYFEFPEIIYLFIIGFFFYYLVSNKLFHYNLSLFRLGQISIVVMIFYTLLWNYYHPKMHYKFSKKNVPYNGLNPFIKWLYRNHTLHHLQKGRRKGNFNIIIPFADFIFGTYNKCVTNKDFCKTKPLNKEMKELCYMEKNKTKLPYGIQFC